MATRPRITLARTYEDFQPPSNLLQEEDCETLIMDLPGFSKEQIRAQMDDRSGTLFISGEQPIANNKWSRFRKELRVPVNCNKSEIQAKFENGVLRIIMPLTVFPKVQRVTDPKPIPTDPKPIAAPPPPPPPPRPSQTPVITEPKPTLPPVIEPKPISSPQSPPSQKPIITESKPIPTPPPPPSQKSDTDTKLTPTLPLPPTQKSGYESQLAPMLRPERQLAPILRPAPSDTPDSQPRRRERPRPKPVPQHPLSQEVVPESNPTPELHDPLSHTQTTDTNQPATPKSTMSQILGIKPKPEIGQDGNSAPIPKVEKHLDLNTGKLKDDEKQEKGKEITDAKQVKGEIHENTRRGVEKLAMDWEESKLYIINMVAALVVIIALWIYTKYTVKTPW